MKKLSSLLLVCVAMVFSSNATAGRQGCEIKKSKIKTQMEYAKRYGNHNRLAGLERALARVEAACSDGYSGASYRLDGYSGASHRLDGYSGASHRLDKIQGKEDKVRRREIELDRAIASGDMEKVRNKAHKLNEAKQELAEARRW
ncbi:DUF1090 domain-containing protein [Serratia rhizosphaerae]|uniref:DUF1090 domain-containing protein n=1 Tax=Serratia sp. Tan611 TaxID=2773264 RepID=UPI000DA33A9F|nr:DUF1090 domain-containing protein [Serratia sp. Tan611]MBU3893297.1 DUF1090 domain-containing protein [Serratia rubidaea]QPT13424.1 DUF1090 domain-containing protein [Serratia rubidaea]CAE1150039.1 conserved exported protein of unknown function [Serratia sp. Tan611]SQJ08169.1 Protein of uncharacterised function (DUF1090) [Serratia rubidaea]